MASQTGSPPNNVTSAKLEHVFRDAARTTAYPRGYKVIAPSITFVPRNTDPGNAVTVGVSASNQRWAKRAGEHLPGGMGTELVWHLQMHVAQERPEADDAQSEELVLIALKKLATLLWLAEPLLSELHGLPASGGRTKPFALVRDSNLAVRSQEHIAAVLHPNNQPSAKALAAYRDWLEPVLATCYDGQTTGADAGVVRSPGLVGEADSDVYTRFGTTSARVLPRDLYLLWLAPTREVLANLLRPRAGWMCPPGPGLVIDFSKMTKRAAADDSQSEGTATMRGDGDDSPSEGTATMRGDGDSGEEEEKEERNTLAGYLRVLAQRAQQVLMSRRRGGGGRCLINAADVRVRAAAALYPARVSEWSRVYAALVYRAGHCTPESFHDFVIRLLAGQGPTMGKLRQWLDGEGLAEATVERN